MSIIKRIFSALIYTIINIGGSFIPFFAAILYPKILDEKVTTFSEITGKGEITIMCIPICISIAFVLYNYKKEIGISRIADFVYIITFFWLIIAAGLYAYGINKTPEPKAGLTTFSIYFLSWTVLSMLISKYIEDENIDTITRQRNNDQINLEERFNRTRD